MKNPLVYLLAMTLLQLLHDTWQYAMDCISAQRRALFDGLFHYCYETLDHVHHRFLHGEQEESVVSERTYRQKPSPATQDSISKGRQKALLIGINYKLSPERHGYSELDGPHEDVDKMAEFLQGT